MLNTEYLYMHKYGKYILVNYFVISFDVSQNNINVYLFRKVDINYIVNSWYLRGYKTFL